MNITPKRLREVLEAVVQVIPKPDNEPDSGYDWWVGCDLSPFGCDQGLWDTTCPTKELAERVRKEFIEGFLSSCLSGEKPKAEDL